VSPEEAKAFEAGRQRERAEAKFYADWANDWHPLPDQYAAGYAAAVRDMRNKQAHENARAFWLGVRAVRKGAVRYYTSWFGPDPTKPPPKWRRW
jgi:hypothetical protein